MEIVLNSCNTSFMASPGPKLLKQVTNEFKGDKIRVAKFSRLFEDTFLNNTDNNTVIDIDKSRNLIFSNKIFPDIKYSYHNNSTTKKKLAEYLLNECPKTISWGENSLFRLIISKEFLKGKSFEQMAIIAQKANLTKTFRHLLSIAEKIIEANPKSKLHRLEFDIMEMKIAEEKLKELSSRIFKPEDFEF